MGRGPGDGSEFVKIMTRTVNPNLHLMRFHNMNENLTVNISVGYTFWSPALGNVTNVTEMSLSVNQPMAQVVQNKFDWVNYTQKTANDVNQDYIKDGII